MVSLGVGIDGRVARCPGEQSLQGSGGSTGQREDHMRAINSRLAIEPEYFPVPGRPEQTVAA